MNQTEQHEVTFLTMGKLTAKRWCRPIALWDSTTACRMLHAISDHEGSRPFAFFFTSWRVEPDRVSETSGVVKGKRELIRTSSLFFVSGTVKTLGEIEEQDDGRARILIQNLRAERRSDQTRAITVNNTSYHPLSTGDANLDANGRLLEVCP